MESKMRTALTFLVGSLVCIFCCTAALTMARDELLTSTDFIDEYLRLRAAEQQDATATPGCAPTPIYWDVVHFYEISPEEMRAEDPEGWTRLVDAEPRASAEELKVWACGVRQRIFERRYGYRFASVAGPEDSGD